MSIIRQIKRKFRSIKDKSKRAKTSDDYQSGLNDGVDSCSEIIETMFKNNAIAGTSGYLKLLSLEQLKYAAKTSAEMIIEIENEPTLNIWGLSNGGTITKWFEQWSECRDFSIAYTKENLNRLAADQNRFDIEVIPRTIPRSQLSNYIDNEQ